MKTVTRYKLPVIRKLSPRDVLYNTTTKKLTLLYMKVVKRVNPKCSHHKEKNSLIMYLHEIMDVH